MKKSILIMVAVSFCMASLAAFSSNPCHQSKNWISFPQYAYITGAFSYACGLLTPPYYAGAKFCQIVTIKGQTPAGTKYEQFNVGFSLGWGVKTTVSQTCYTNIPENGSAADPNCVLSNAAALCAAVAANKPIP